MRKLSTISKLVNPEDSNHERNSNLKNLMLTVHIIAIIEIILATIVEVFIITKDFKLFIMYSNYFEDIIMSLIITALYLIVYLLFRNQQNANISCINHNIEKSFLVR